MAAAKISLRSMAMAPRRTRWRIVPVFGAAGEWVRRGGGLQSDGPWPRLGGRRTAHGIIRGLARIALRRVEGHRRDLASVDADRRQGAARADAVAQSFLARHAPRQRARARHAADPSRWAHDA